MPDNRIVFAIIADVIGLSSGTDCLWSWSVARWTLGDRCADLEPGPAGLHRGRSHLRTCMFVATAMSAMLMIILSNFESSPPIAVML